VARMLGKLPVKIIPGVRALSDYIAPGKRLTVPPMVTNTQALGNKFPMFGNDRLPDCTIASIGHIARAWLLSNDQECDITDNDVIGRFNEYPNNENGLVVARVLKDWHKRDFYGVSLNGLATISPHSFSMLRLSLFLFGGSYYGWSLPRAVQDMDEWPAPPPDLTGDWEVNSWGGHAAPLLDYDSDGNFYVVTWGKRLKVHPRFILAYAEEAYALLSDEWADANGAPNNIDYLGLKNDMRDLFGA
jgi:hypothetical protein